MSDQHTGPKARRRRPTQDEALRAVNERRRVAPGHVSVSVQIHLPAGIARRFRALDAKRRGEIITAGLNALEAQE